MSGISAMTNNYNARLRWMITKSARAHFVSKIQEMAGIIQTDDVTSDLHPSRLKRNIGDLQKVVKCIQETCDPFRMSSEDKLYNIHTGKVASEDVRQCLLTIPEKGKARHKQFVDECIQNPDRFEKPISKVKLETFRNERISNRRTKDKKLQELRCTRDLMGRLAVVASQRNLDLETIFSYHLIPAPLSMFSGDETMAKTSKSTLLHELEKKAEQSLPSYKDAVIADGNFLLPILPSNQAATYGALARITLIQAMSLTKNRVYLIFDCYSEPSIKEYERI